MATSAEYINLSYNEKVYGEKNLLQSQLEIINSIRDLKEFKKIRKSELLLKIQLKNKIEETLLAIKEFEKLLPKTTPVKKPRKQDPEAANLEKELLEIKAKLILLQ